MRSIFAAALALSFLVAPAFAAEPADDAAAVKPGEVMPTAEKPEGATALCKDGSWTKTHNHTGACASHKGVSKWLQDI
jgi:hypothetical protein